MMPDEKAKPSWPIRRPPLPRSNSDPYFPKNTNVSSDQSKIEKSPNHSSAREINVDMSHERYDRSITPNVSLNSEDGEEEKTDISGDEVTNSSAEEEETEEKTEVEKEEVSYSDRISSESKSPTNNNPPLTSFVIICILVIAFIIGAFCNMNSEPNHEKNFDIHFLRKNLPTQNEELWLSLESGIVDVVERKRPSTFVLLYEKEAEATLHQLLDQLSKVVTCSLTDCSKKPIILENTELNSEEVVQNFGLLIDRYRNKLEESGVMIVKNLESVYGTSAQAFHTFCDEFTPLVDKSVIIFTMEVDKLPSYDKRMEFIENYLKNKWTDVKLDTRNALITRITSMVLEVQP